MNVYIPKIQQPKLIETIAALYGDPSQWQIKDTGNSSSPFQLPQQPRPEVLKQILAEAAKNKTAELFKAYPPRNNTLTLTLTKAPEIMKMAGTRTLTWNLHREGKALAENILVSQKEPNGPVECLVADESAQKLLAPFNKIVGTLLANYKPRLQIAIES